MSEHLIDSRQLAQRVRELPALPQAALDALAALRDDSVSAEQCAELIGRDQALVARVLRLANSAFYGVPGRVGNIRDAVYLLGRRTLGSLLTVATLSQQFDASGCPGFSFDGFWRHAVGVALASRMLARRLDGDEDAAFTVGLLHDIGSLALAAHFPRQMAAVLRQRQAHDGSEPDIERAVLGTDHVELGTRVATQWHFPREVVAAIAGHHAPPAPGGSGAGLADIVHVADAMVHALDLAGDADEVVPALDAAAWDRVALTPGPALQVLADTERGVSELCQAMGLLPRAAAATPQEIAP